jgi:transcription elongation factor GreA
MRVPYRKPTKFSDIKSDPLLTEEKFRELKNKLDRLIKISRPQAAAEVRRLAELGDFSENAEYQLAKGKLRSINHNILIINSHLTQAQIIKPQTQTSSSQLGHKVTVEFGGKQKTYQILGSSETDPQKGIISYTSPVGEALLGHKIGDLVRIKLAGQEVEYKIIKIE